MSSLDSAFHVDGSEVGVHAGFPNAAADQSASSLSLDKLLIHSPHSTFFFRVRGHHWRTMGIFDGDIAVVDRSLHPTRGETVVGFTDRAELILAKWDEIAPSSSPLTLWGVVTSTIHVLSEGGQKGTV